MGNNKLYDLIIIGAGPAGLSASIYASRYKLDHLIFGVEQGGQMNEIYDIENWPGSTKISGADLIQKFVEHVENFGVKINRESIAGIAKKEDGTFEIKSAKNIYKTRALILAMGAKARKANIPGEKEFTGRGVSYCATCDAMFFREKTVCVVGSGNSAAVVALELTDFAKKIYLITKEEKMSVEPAWLEKISVNSKIELIKGTGVIEIKGENKVEKVVLDKVYKDKNNLEVDGVFIEVGTEPGVELAQKIGVATDEQNYIRVKEDMSTNVSGVFASGDITTGSSKFRQVLTACAEGSIAANSAYKMLKLK
ncbi:MAG TPA: FAD-dependent oxidoreductase [Candidatus Moranbacteria bacterium]|nr:FAD-dependent oxidoreductase [Candidatus Moranbacteria bacterium]